MSVFAIEIENVTKSYPTGFLGRGRKPVIKGISLKIPEGEMFGVLGPNGAGKTTLLSILSNLLTPDTGTVKIFGKDAVRNPQFVRLNVSLSSGNPNLTWCMTVRENLTYYAMLQGMIGKARRSRIEEVIALLELDPNRNTRYDELSTGTKQRLALAKALLPKPRILFLDEPTIGLDPQMAIKIRKMIIDLHKNLGITVLLTSHYMKEVEDLCRTVVFIKDGVIKAEGTPGELKKTISFKLDNPTMEDVFLELVQ